jgi:hypothetical protein
MGRRRDLLGREPQALKVPVIGRRLFDITNGWDGATQKTRLP